MISKVTRHDNDDDDDDDDNDDDYDDDDTWDKGAKTEYGFHRAL